jgi:hypothetical protein
VYVGACLCVYLRPKADSRSPWKEQRRLPLRFSRSQHNETPLIAAAPLPPFPLVSPLLTVVSKRLEEQRGEQKGREETRIMRLSVCGDM